MAMRGTALTLSDEVYQLLLGQILEGVFAPGAKLRSSELKDTFDVSLGVVREALTRLSEQRLVVASPNQGFAVATLSEKVLRELVQLRMEVEGFAVGLSVTEGDLAWESGVIAAHHRLERTPSKAASGTPNAEWANMHAHFHAQLVAGCDNEFLRQLCGSLFRSAEHYRIWSDPRLEGSRDVAGEHRELMMAAVARDSDRVTSLLRRHIRLTGEYALRNLPAPG
jgi:DNA-binding GntR family transcriptional regulator